MNLERFGHLEWRRLSSHLQLCKLKILTLIRHLISFHTRTHRVVHDGTRFISWL